MPSRKLRHLLVRVERNWNFQQTLRHNKIPNCMSLRHVFLRDVPFEKREMVAANTQHFQFCERAFRVIRSPIVFSDTLHENTFKLRNDSHFANHYHIIIRKSFNYSNTQSDMFYLVFFSGTKNKIQNKVAILTAALYNKHVNTQIPTLLWSTSCSVGVPRSQSPETNDNLTIRPKKTISSMLVSVPVIHEKVICKFSVHFLHVLQWTQWRTVTINQFFSHSFIGRSQTENSQSFWSLYNFSSLLLVPNFMFKLLDGWRFQAGLQTLFHIMLRKNSLNVPAKYSFPILTFVPRCTCATEHL